MSAAIPIAYGVTARPLLPVCGPIGLYELAFEPDAAIELHAHHQHEAWTVTAGSGVLVVADKQILLSVGTAEAVVGGIPHAIRAGYDGLTLLAVAVPDWTAP